MNDLRLALRFRLQLLLACLFAIGCTTAFALVA